MKMKDSKALLLDYLASVRDPARAASLFADDGVFELPFLRSLGVEPRYTGRSEITALVRKLLEIYPNFAFAPDDTRIPTLQEPAPRAGLCKADVRIGGWQGVGGADADQIERTAHLSVSRTNRRAASHRIRKAAIPRLSIPRQENEHHSRRYR
jgi:hypothetical protein